MIHELKCEPEYFQAVADGDKLFEVRFNDRKFMVGDFIALNECEHNEGMALDNYTGRSVLARISYILDDERFCKPGHVILGFRICGVASSPERFPERMLFGEERTLACASGALRQGDGK
mgnify:CR=1 FL=1